MHVARLGPEMRGFIRELRRREVFRTLGLYVGVCWILIEAGSILLPVFEAPVWLLQSLVVIAVIGFPVVAALAWLYDMSAAGIGRDRGESDAPVPPFGGRKMDFVVIGVLAGALTFSVYLNLRSGSPPPEVLEPVAVVVADFENRTGDPIFEGLLEQALTMGIQNAPHVAILDRNVAQGMVDEIASSSGGLPVDAARLAAVREGAGMVLSGSIEAVDGGFQLRLSGLDPASGDIDFEVVEEANGRDDVLEAVSSLSVVVREVLGDPTLRDIDPVVGSRAGERRGLSTTSIEAARAYTLGQRASFEGRLEEAVDYYRRATDLDPNFGSAYSGWATVAYMLDRREESERLFEKTLTLLDMMSDRTRLSRLGTYYYTTQNHEKALETFAELAERYPGSAAALNNLAVSAFMTLDFERAQNMGRRVLEIFPNRSLFRTNYALYAMYAGRFDVAEKEALALLESNPNWGTAYLPLAMARLAKRDVDGARDAYRGMMDATEGRLRQSAATLGLADVDIYVGNFARARERLEAGISQDQAELAEYAAALKEIALAEAHVETGDVASAVAAVRDALELSDSTSVRVPAVLVLLAADGTDAVERVASELVAALQPHSRAYGMMIRGAVLREAGRHVEAIELLRSALEIADLWRVRFELGHAYLDAGYYAEAYDEFQRCGDRRAEATALFLEDMPTFRYLAPLPYWVARAQEGLNMRATAAASYAAFLELRPSGGTLVDDARERLAELESID
jgi:tetratricopeptide (TPR) repeat protein